MSVHSKLRSPRREQPRTREDDLHESSSSSSSIPSDKDALSKQLSASSKRKRRESLQEKGTLNVRAAASNANAPASLMLPHPPPSPRSRSRSQITSNAENLQNGHSRRDSGSLNVRSSRISLPRPTSEEEEDEVPHRRVLRQNGHSATHSPRQLNHAPVSSSSASSVGAAELAAPTFIPRRRLKPSTPTLKLRAATAKIAAKRAEAESECHICGGDVGDDEGEPFLSCAKCGKSVHPQACARMGQGVTDTARKYLWRCSGCKTCEECSGTALKAPLFQCELCDRGWHGDCVDPPLQKRRKERFQCPKCTETDTVRLSKKSRSSAATAADRNPTSPATRLSPSKDDTVGQTITPGGSLRRSSKTQLVQTGTPTATGLIVRRYEPPAQRRPASGQLRGSEVAETLSLLARRPESLPSPSSSAKKGKDISAETRERPVESGSEDGVSGVEPQEASPMRKVSGHQSQAQNFQMGSEEESTSLGSSKTISSRNQTIASSSRPSDDETASFTKVAASKAPQSRKANRNGFTEGNDDDSEYDEAERFDEEDDDDVSIDSAPKQRRSARNKNHRRSLPRQYSRPLRSTVNLDDQSRVISSGTRKGKQRALDEDADGSEEEVAGILETVTGLSPQHFAQRRGQAQEFLPARRAGRQAELDGLDLIASAEESLHQDAQEEEDSDLQMLTEQVSRNQVQHGPDQGAKRPPSLRKSTDSKRSQTHDKRVSLNVPPATDLSAVNSRKRKRPDEDISATNIPFPAGLLPLKAPKPKRKKKPPPPAVQPMHHFPAFPTSYIAEASAEEQEDDYVKVLTPQQASTTDRVITDADRRRVEAATARADAIFAEGVRNTIPFQPFRPAVVRSASTGPSTAIQRVSMPEASQGTLPPDVLESSALPPALKGLRARSTIKATSSFLDELEAERAPATPTGALLPDGAYSNVRQIVFGDRKIQIWYQAPYPEEVARVPQGTLWLCEHCLKYLKTQYQLERHRKKCGTKHPPGDEIYRDGGLSVWEIDGRKSKIFCQNLCLLSKMFLDHKTLYYDVDPFLFYVLTEQDTDGSQFIGYFSKEKRSPTNNLSCIMTLPVRQQGGYGQFLVDFSYLLTRKEGRTGTPEQPLSDLGMVLYYNYWKTAVYKYAFERPNERHRIESISKATGMRANDVYWILANLGAIEIDDVGADSSEDECMRDWSKRFKLHLSGGLARPTVLELDKPLPRSYRISFDVAAVKEHVEAWGPMMTAIPPRVDSTLTSPSTALRSGPIILPDSSSENDELDADGEEDDDLPLPNANPDRAKTPEVSEEAALLLQISSPRTPRVNT